MPTRPLGRTGVDVPMISLGGGIPFLEASDELSEAMDACHEAGIGLVSMVD